MIVSFVVPSIHCVLCEAPIRSALQGCADLAINQLEIDITEKKISVTISDDEDLVALQNRLTEILSDIGHQPVFGNPSLYVPNQKRHWIFGILGIISGIAILGATMMMGALSMSLMIPLAAGSTLLTLVLGFSSFKRAILDWRQSKALTMDTLFAVSTVLVLVVSALAFVVPWLPMMFDTGLLIFGFRHIGLAIEQSLRQFMRFGQRFSERLPKEVRVQKGGAIVLTKLHQVKPDELIEIKAGELIPLDGELLSDRALLNNTIVSGSPYPRPFKKGEPLLAGMSVAPGSSPVIMRVTHVSEQSYLKRLDRLIFNAKRGKAPLETQAQKILFYFIPALFVLSLVSLGLVACFFPAAVAIRCAIAVLVSACPCTLGLVVPLAVKIGMDKAAKHGVFFSSAEPLQRAAEVKRVLIDLHGTLTVGVPKVTRYGIIRGNAFTKANLFDCLAAFEQDSEHLVGRALFHFGTKHQPKPKQALIKKHDFGVTATMDGAEYALGSKRMMEELGIDVSSIEAQCALGGGDSVVYLARDQRLVAYVVLTDPLRLDAQRMVDLLRQQGLEPEILTGADASTAHRYANQLGIPPAQVHAGYAGSDVGGRRDKATYIRELRQKGLRVAMIGDAANDALAIAESDFGIAISSAGADAVTLNHAGAIIQGESLLPVVSAFTVAKQTVRHIKQSLMINFIYNIGVELVAGGVLAVFGVVLNPGIGVALMIIQMSLILLHAYRFKHRSETDLQKTSGKRTTASNDENLEHDGRSQSPRPQHVATAKPDVVVRASLFNNSPTETSLSTQSSHLQPQKVY